MYAKVQAFATPAKPITANLLPTTSSEMDEDSRVVLLIDVQKWMLEEESTLVPYASQVKENIAQILTEARNASPAPVIIHIRNSGEPGETDEPGTPGWELVFEPLAQEPVVDKPKNNAFAGTDLEDMINPFAEIIVVGLQTHFDVKATCMHALRRGNSVMLIKEAHSTYDRDDTALGGEVKKANNIRRVIERELEDAGVVVLEMEDVPDIFNDR